MKIGDCFHSSTEDMEYEWAKILSIPEHGFARVLYVITSDCDGCLPCVRVDLVWAPELRLSESRGWKPATPEAFNDAYNKALVDIEAYNVHADYVKEEGL